jgi:hypothetical protein
VKDVSACNRKWRTEGALRSAAVQRVSEEKLGTPDGVARLELCMGLPCSRGSESRFWSRVTATCKCVSVAVSVQTKRAKQNAARTNPVTANDVWIFETIQ